MSFAAGFAAGSGAIAAGQRIAELRKQREMQQEEWAFKKAELEKQKQIAADLAAAGQDPAKDAAGFVVGQEGSRNFTKDRATADHLSQMEADIAELEGQPVPKSAPAAASMAAESVAPPPETGSARPGVAEVVVNPEQAPAATPVAARQVGTSTAGRPLMRNPDGTVSSERTITVEADGKHHLIPTIVGGKQLGQEEAIALWEQGKNPPVGVFDSAESAEVGAKARSASLAPGFAADDRAQVKAALGMGNEIMSPDDPRARDTKAAYLARVGEVFKKHGDVDKVLKVDEITKNIRKSGIVDATQALLVGGPDAVEEAEKILRESGVIKLNGKLVATPSVRQGADGSQIPDVSIGVQDKDGNVRTIGSALQMNYLGQHPEKYVELIKGEHKTALDEGHRASQLALQGRQVGVAERNADTMAQYRKDQLDIARMNAETSRMKKSGGGGGADDGFKFPQMSASDEKAARDIAATALGGDTADPAAVNMLSDAAIRLTQMSAAQGKPMTMSQAINIAKTPGATQRLVQTNKGVFPAIELPSGEVHIIAPGATPFKAPAKKEAEKPKDNSPQSSKVEDNKKPAAAKPAAEPVKPKTEEKKSGLGAEVDKIGSELDEARKAAAKASRDARSWGTKRQRDNPEEWAKVKTARDEAETRRRELQARFERAASSKIEKKD